MMGPSTKPNFPAQKLYQPDAVHVGQHESLHGLIAGPACVSRRITRSVYDCIEMQCVILPEEGYFVLKFPEGSVPESVQTEIAQLGAFGPIAAVDDIASYVRSKDFDTLAEKGGLSDGDVELCRAYSGPPLLPLTLCLATRAMLDRLGRGKAAMQAKLMSEITRQDLPFLLLKDLVPYDIAQWAYEEGRNQLKALLK